MLRPLFLFLASIAVVLAQTPATKNKKAPTAGQKDRAVMGELASATEPSAIQIVPGFKVELLHTVPKPDQGSWVALTVIPRAG